MLYTAAITIMAFAATGVAIGLFAYAQSLKREIDDRDELIEELRDANGGRSSDDWRTNVL